MKTFQLSIPIALLFFLLIFPIMVKAKDLGVFGQTYPILEDDFLKLIELRYKEMKENGEWSEKQKNWQSQIINYAERPKAVAGISTTKKPRAFFIDPSIVISQDIFGVNGEVI